jgi:hypothetical protein
MCYDMAAFTISRLTERWVLADVWSDLLHGGIESNHVVQAKDAQMMC